MTESQSMECPTCDGRGAITVDRERRCDRSDCDELAVWDYYNEISGADLDLCDDHLGDLRPDLHPRVWVEKGFAQRIRP